MGEHFDFDQFAPRAADVVLGDFAVDARHLLQRQFARQHHRVGPLRKELDGFGVGDVALGRNVDLDPHAAGIEDGGHVGGDDGIDPLGLGAVDDLVDRGDFFFVDHRVDRQIGFQPCFVGDSDDAGQVVGGEVGRRGRPHVELSDAEVDRVGARLDGGRQGLVGAYRGHDFDVAAQHCVQCGIHNSEFMI